MKVMFAVPSFWPSQDGVANITGYLARGLAERGHEILIFTSAGKSGLQVLPESETKVLETVNNSQEAYDKWNAIKRPEKARKNL